MKKVSSVNQLLDLLNLEEQKVLAGIMAHLSPEAEELLAMVLVAYLRFKVRPRLDTAFIQGLAQNFICYLETARQSDSLHVGYAVNPVMLIDLHENYPDNYKAVIETDGVITKKEATDFMSSLITNH